jgi:hypothetical protein
MRISIYFFGFYFELGLRYGSRSSENMRRRGGYRCVRGREGGIIEEANVNLSTYLEGVVRVVRVCVTRGVERVG